MTRIKADSYDDLIDALKALQCEAPFDIEVHSAHTFRTVRQQAALEVSCRELATALNDQGFDQQIVLPKVRASEVWWTQSTVKDNLYKPLLLVMHGKNSTTQLERAQVSEVYDKLCAILVTKLDGFTPPGFASES